MKVRSHICQILQVSLEDVKGCGLYKSSELEEGEKTVGAVNTAVTVMLSRVPWVKRGKCGREDKRRAPEEFGRRETEEKKRSEENEIEQRKRSEEKSFHQWQS